MRQLSRRDVLATGAGVLAVAAFGIDGAQAANNAPDLIKAFTGGKAATEGKVKLDLPEIAENGNSVTLAFDIDHPMTPERHVTDVLVIADSNPSPRVATFRFTPMSGRAAAATRIRLAGTQVISVLAKTSDGKLFMAQRQVKVTVGGCGG